MDDLTIEEVFNCIKRFNPKSKQVFRQIDAFLESKDLVKEKINDYYLIKFKTEYFITKNDRSVYKSFFNKEDAINYCLDKINTESRQYVLLS